YLLSTGRCSSAAPANTSRALPAGSSKRSRPATRRSASSAGVAALTATPAPASARPTSASASSVVTSQPEASSRSRSPGRTTSRAGKSSILRYSAPASGPRPSAMPSTRTPNSRQAPTSGDSMRRYPSELIILASLAGASLGRAGGAPDGAVGGGSGSLFCLQEADHQPV